MSYTSYGNVRVATLSLWMPLLGLWTAQVGMATGDTLPATGTLQHGNLALAGAVYRQATIGGQTTALLVGGFGGWGNALSPRGYNSPFGVFLSTIVNDAAVECGEQAAVVTDQIVGTFWARPTSRQGVCRGGDVLRAVAGPSWWVNSAGVVQVGPRTGTTITSDFDVEEWDGGAGIMTVGTEDIASWVPANSFSNAFVKTPQTISAVRHTVDRNGMARVRVVVT